MSAHLKGIDGGKEGEEKRERRETDLAQKLLTPPSLLPKIPKQRRSAAERPTTPHQLVPSRTTLVGPRMSQFRLRRVGH